MAICKVCGKEFEPRGASRGMFCSRSCVWACRFEHPQKTAPTPDPEWLPKAIELYRTGLGCRKICLQLGLKANYRESMVKWLKRAGVFTVKTRSEGIRAGKRLEVGTKRAPGGTDARVVRLQYEEFKRDCKSVAPFDELEHWGRTGYNQGHIEFCRWYGAQVANRTFNNHKANPEYRLKRAMRTRVWKVLHDQFAPKHGRTLELIGCTVSELRQHLQSQFIPGMTWDNYGIMWEVDHIIACSNYDLTKPEHQRECFHFSNLQPLTVTGNRSKHASF